MSETGFRPGLEGVIAVETEIAEPDREGSALRYRGVDIEELVGHVPYDRVWGLLVDDDLDSRMPDPEPYEPAALTGNAPADLQAETARLASVWGLGKLNEISDAQAREDLGRLSAMMMEIVARSARVADGHPEPVPDEVVAHGATAAEKFLLRWRGEADPRHVTAIDTYWICTAEHGLNASTFTARVVASTGADCGAALSAAVGALSGPLHGGAPAYVIPMLREVQELGDPERWVEETLDAGKRIMGFGHRVYRTEDPRARHMRERARALSARLGQAKWYTILQAVEQEMIPYQRHGIYVNVDFY
ncbi:MAG: citrate synthase, partial [Gaiellaceae bacterium]|nr:citrate synthase [Gaiellaceae bacterium]